VQLVFRKQIYMFRSYAVTPPPQVHIYTKLQWVMHSNLRVNAKCFRFSRLLAVIKVIFTTQRGVLFNYDYTVISSVQKFNWPNWTPKWNTYLTCNGVLCGVYIYQCSNPKHCCLNPEHCCQKAYHYKMTGKKWTLRVKLWTLAFISEHQCSFSVHISNT
jgi:hypothetical protein